ncbi:hypothetical protein RDABS01_012973 [Bienertia sinuspersici]
MACFKWADGPTYPWSGLHMGNNRETGDQIFEQLDRAYSNENWRCLFLEAFIVNHEIIASDHGAILLETSPKKTKRKRPYKIEAWCLEKYKVKEIIKQKKKDLGITWDKFKEELEATREETNGWWYGTNEVEKRRQCQEKARDQLMYWKQRVKIKWDLLGDQCTSFFFRSAKTRKGRNTIGLLKKEDGNWLRDVKEISYCFLNNYTQLFNPAKSNQANLDEKNKWFTDLPKLQEEDLNILLQPFQREEIKEAVKGMKLLKALGPDGFPPVFYHKHWDSVGEDIWKAINSFFTGGKLLKEINKTFITLIPKVERPETVNDFRPISLCNTVYKIIAKCMVGRLKRVLPNLVGENQNAFVPGRQITDNCLLANEMLHLLKTRKRGRNYLGILKVDLRKAYDRIRWDFLEKVLVSMNFPAVWVGWIMECVTTVKYAILVNGSPTKEFTPSAGLRQGDPISPYLFILCMEVLSKRMETLQGENLLKGIAVNRNRERISHLFFANDALFSFEASPESCSELRSTLEDFCAISGEMINYKKSHVQFNRNTPLKFVRYMRKPLRVRSQEKMGTYLGCPMKVDGRNTSTFNQIHDRVLQCMSSWKYSCLSPDPRSILINSILVTLAAHIMSIYLIPQKNTEVRVWHEGREWATLIQEEIWAGKEPVTFRNKANGSHSEKLKLEISLKGAQPKGFYPHTSRTKRKRMRSFGYRKKMFRREFEAARVWEKSSRTPPGWKASANQRGIIEMANAELNRWYEGFVCRERNDITHETGKQECTYADMWEHGVQQHCQNYLQFDGAWKQKRNGGVRAAYGWVLNKGNNVKRTGTSKIFALSPLQAEAHGLLAGIKTAKAKVDVVQISTDSKRLVQILRDPKSAPVDCAHILSKILCTLK